jgi:hypothetical protein
VVTGRFEYVRAKAPAEMHGLTGDHSQRLRALGVGQAFQPDIVPQILADQKDHVRLESLTYKKARPKVSLITIVRDEEENLPNCLRSVDGLFDEIVIVDAGSKGRTREIAQEFGARVFDFVWVDDFAAARNAALARFLDFRRRVRDFRQPLACAGPARPCRRRSLGG